MDGRIEVQLRKGGELVSSKHYAGISAHPGVDLSPVVEAIILTGLAYALNCKWLYIAAAEKAQQAIKGIIKGSSKSYFAAGEVSVSQDECDYISVIYRARSEDQLKSNCQQIVFAPGEASLDRNEHGAKTYTVGFALNANHLFTGTYPFVFGAQDNGVINDVAVVNRLNLRFQAVQPHGWTRVPGGAGYWVGNSHVDVVGSVTDASLACTLFKGQIFLFSKGMNNGKIYFTSLSEDMSWSSWEQVPGDGVTDVAPSTAAFNGWLYLFAKHTDGRIYVNRMNDGKQWEGWSDQIGGTTDVGLCAVAAFEQLFLFSKGGADHRIYVNKKKKAQDWGGWTPFSESTTHFSLSAGYIKNLPRLFLFMVGAENKISVNSTLDGAKWTGWKDEIGGTTDVGITACENRFKQGSLISAGLEIFAKGIEDKRIYRNELIPSLTAGGFTTTGWKPVEGHADVAMACVHFARNVYLFRKGVSVSLPTGALVEDGRIYVTINP